MDPNHIDAFTSAIKASQEEKTINPEWEARILELSRICPYRKCRYFLALFICYLVARASDKTHNESIRVNLPRGTRRGFQVRGIAKNVAAIAIANDIDIGSTSSDCLNGSPAKSGDVRDMTEIVNTRNEEGNQHFQKMLADLSSLSSERCREILATYCKAMRKEGRASIEIKADSYPAFIIELTTRLKEDGDYGNVAVAAVGGALSAVFRSHTIHVGKTNDPDRKHPCDVSVIDAKSKEVVASFEVKDKQVTPAEIHLAIKKMEQESHLPKDITFCLFRGLDGSQSAAVKAIASFGYTPKIFTSPLDFLTHCMVISGLDPDDFGRVVAKKMDDIYGTITM